MTIEELRDANMELENKNKELQALYDASVKQNESDTARIKELEDYNRKMFSNYVLGKEKAEDPKPSAEATLDSIIKNLKEKIRKKNEFYSPK